MIDVYHPTKGSLSHQALAVLMTKTASWLTRLDKDKNKITELHECGAFDWSFRKLDRAVKLSSAKPVLIVHHPMGDVKIWWDGTLVPSKARVGTNDPRLVDVERELSRYQEIEKIVYEYLEKLEKDRAEFIELKVPGSVLERFQESKGDAKMNDHVKAEAKAFSPWTGMTTKMTGKPQEVQPVPQDTHHAPLPHRPQGRGA